MNVYDVAGQSAEDMMRELQHGGISSEAAAIFYIAAVEMVSLGRVTARLLAFVRERGLLIWACKDGSLVAIDISTSSSTYLPGVEG